ncbi:unnamed protein product [Cladocopium goreaui]|uniref:Pyruvate dehydrogenase [NADP(+)], mitochondrial n=1 Tax=Cladocopium goreaui TaxID=2562237 RepID=A0A9P1BS49_9DINO|nr:unnamed protein product [Cladocopium goreaui]
MNDALCAVAKEATMVDSWDHETRITVRIKREGEGHRIPTSILGTSHSASHGFETQVSTKLTLPKFDLIFCEVFDAGLLGEYAFSEIQTHALPTILHARRELLKPNGILIPARAKIFGQIVEAPELLERFAVLESPAGVWTPRYSNLGNWIDPPLELRVQKTGVAHALIYWWELQLDGAGNSRIHTSQRGGCESWEQAVKPLTLPLEDVPLREHEIVRLRLALRRQADGLEVILEDWEGSQMTWRSLGSSFDISSIFTVAKGARCPPEEAKVQGKDLPSKTDVGVAHILDPNTGLGINWAIMAWHWTMVLVFLMFYFAVAYWTTPMGSNVPWLTLFQKLLVFWNFWEALGLGVIHGPMQGKVNPPFQDWWYRFTVGSMKYTAPFMPCLSMKRNCLDVLVEGFLMYALTIRVLLAPEVTPELMQPLVACLIYEFLFDHGQHMHTYGTQTMYCFIFMCFPVDQGQVVALQLFMTWFYICSGWCKIGPWFKYLNVSNLWSAKYMVSVPWSDCFRRTMYKGYKDADYRLTRAAKVFSVVCALCETLGPLLVLSNDPILVQCGIVVICCMHLYIISTLVVDVFTWNFVDALMYCFIFGLYGPSVGA